MNTGMGFLPHKGFLLCTQLIKMQGDITRAPTPRASAHRNSTTVAKDSRNGFRFSERVNGKPIPRAHCPLERTKWELGRKEEE